MTVRPCKRLLVWSRRTVPVSISRFSAHPIVTSNLQRKSEIAENPGARECTAYVQIIDEYRTSSAAMKLFNVAGIQRC